MSQPIPEPTRSISPRARAEAATWLAKLHGPDRSATVESAWRNWLAEDPEHERAWELATDTWSDTEGLSSPLPHRVVPYSAMSRRRHRFHRPTIAALAASLVLAGIAVDYFLPKSAVTTGLGEQRMLSLADGTRVELNTNTRLVPQYDKHTRTVLLKSGEAYFNVAHERRPFVVEVGSRKVIAVGTSFVVRRDESSNGALTVTLIEGRVAVAPMSAPNVLPAGPIPEVTVLSAGKRLRAAPHVATTVDNPSIDRETAWMRGQLVFEETPLREAVAEFNRYSALQIELRSKEAERIAVGGVFRIGDSASFAAAVAQSHNLKLTEQEHTLVLESVGAVQADESISPRP